MLVPHFSWKTRFRPSAFSIGYCLACQQEGVVRIERVVEIFCLYDVIPLSETCKGIAARCDFCQRHVEVVRNADGIPLADWSPSDGVGSLYKKLGLAVPSALPPSSSEARLHSLLSAIERYASASRFQLGPWGIVCGILLGAVIPIPLAAWLHEKGLVHPPPDEQGFVMLSALVGMFLGAIVGPTVEFFLRRRRSVASRIREAYEKYPFDLLRLEELSEGYSKNVRKAVCAAGEDVLRRL